MLSRLRSQCAQQLKYDKTNDTEIKKNPKSSFGIDGDRRKRRKKQTTTRRRNNNNNKKSPPSSAFHRESVRTTHTHTHLQLTYKSTIRASKHRPID